MTQRCSLGEYAADLIRESCLQGNLGVLHESLTPEYQSLLPIAELGRRLAKMEEDHGIFTSIGAPSEPQESSADPGFYDIRIPLSVGKIQWTAHVSINQNKKIRDLKFVRQPIYIAAAYYNPHKVISRNLNESPQIIYSKPAIRKTNKLPIAVLLHSAVYLDIDGHFGQRYPYKDLEFLAQKKVGLIRSAFDSKCAENPIIAVSSLAIQSALSLEEQGGIFILAHGFASLFLPEILAKFCRQISGVVLINPAWESVPGSNIPNMSPERVPKDIKTLIIGSENDQIMVKDHWEAWKSAMPEAEAKWLTKVDHFLMDCQTIPTTDDYSATEAHVSEAAQRLIAKWVYDQFSQN